MEWRERINRAIKRGTFNDTDRKLALSYATCAVGERIAQLRGQGIEPKVVLIDAFDRFGHKPVEVPIMEEVRSAAVMFFGDVSNAGRPGYGDPECALRWYDQIQAWDGS